MKYPEEILSERVKELEEQLAAAMRIIKATYPDKFPGNYFICGEAGDKDDNGLPDKVIICPAYGCDWVVMYSKDKT